MARLKLPAIAAFTVYCLANMFGCNYVFNCSGKKIVPQQAYLKKILSSRNLFKRQPRIDKEPEYLVKITSCYNAWADTHNNLITFSEPAIRDFDSDEFLGLLAHEFGHLEFPREDRQWKIDVVAAGYVGRDIVLKKNYKMQAVLGELIRKNKTIVYVFPITHLVHRWANDERNGRIAHLKNLPE